jgi:hypothetical protein
MQCKDLEAVLEQDSLGALPATAREHLATCAACQDFLADLSAIVVTAKQIPAEAAPPDRVWISIRAQLESEGVIRERSENFPPGLSWSQRFLAPFSGRTLATVGVGLALAVAGILQIHKAPTTTGVSPEKPVAEAKVVEAQGLATPATSPGPQLVGDLLPPPSENAFAAQNALDQGERDLPNVRLSGNSRVDAALRKNLRTVNQFIAECEHHLKKNPNDEMAREYLNSAYQQKAELLSAILESGRSEN